MKFLVCGITSMTVCLSLLPAPAFAEHLVVCSGEAAGGYAAFPDVCRLPSGELVCVFYSGYGHVSKPNDKWPKGGRIMAVRSSDEGRHWSAPTVAIDTAWDDRDPSVACLKDGTLIMNWFTPPADGASGERLAVRLARSSDQGKTWSEPAKLELNSTKAFACSTPVRQLGDGSLILGLYREEEGRSKAYGATIKSYDGGKTWKDLALIGEKSDVYLDAETDVVELGSGKLLAALRSSKTDMHFARSDDAGKSWGGVQSFGFKGHSPYFLRHSSGVILLAHRLPGTALHWLAPGDDRWQGPVAIDTVIGAYPSLVELPGGTVYCVYYTEGPGSSIRGARLQVSKSGVQLSTDEPPKP